MFCKQCGTEMVPGAVFCANCGWSCNGSSQPQVSYSVQPTVIHQQGPGNMVPISKNEYFARYGSTGADIKITISWILYILATLVSLNYVGYFWYVLYKWGDFLMKIGVDPERFRTELIFYYIVTAIQWFVPFSYGMSAAGRKYVSAGVGYVISTFFLAGMVLNIYRTETSKYMMLGLLAASIIVLLFTISLNSEYKANTYEL